MGCEIKLTAINVHLVDDESKLKAVVSVVLMNCFAIHGVKVIDGPNGLFVAMPNRRNKNGSFSDIVHPINRECRQYLSEEILEAYKQSRENENDAHNIVLEDENIEVLGIS